MRDEVVDVVARISALTGLPGRILLQTLKLSAPKFSAWRKVYGQPRQRRTTPCRHWILPEEKAAVVEFKRAHMTVGYRALTWMMIDADIVFLSPSTVLRILAENSLNSRWTSPPGEPRRAGFTQPQAAHEQWHTDIAYVNMRGTFVFLISVIDGYSRAVLAWDIRERMETFDVSMVVTAAHERWIAGTDLRPRLISDNGSQFLSGEFKDFLREQGIRHSRTAVGHPQSNGKIERFHKTAKQEHLRQAPAVSLEEMRSQFGEWIEQFNNVRLHSAIGYVAPYDALFGRRDAIIADRQEKLLAAKRRRQELNKSQGDLKRGAA